MELYPLKFAPVYKSRVWGGDRILTYKGLPPVENQIGESWELSGISGSESIVSEGPLAGQTLPDLVRRFRGALVGGHVYRTYGAAFPLLVKLLDAQRDLSVQVHPNDELAAASQPGGRGKTEMWYVLDHDPGACLLSGLKRGLCPEELRKMAEAGTITDELNRCEVRPGDVFFIPSGRIHALGAGCLVAEIQQTSDITYRIYDYGRMGLDGKPRELHLDQAEKAIDYNAATHVRTEYVREKNHQVVLADCPYFTTALYELDQSLTFYKAAWDSFLIIICTEGTGWVRTDVGAAPIRRGETLLLPACADSVSFVPDGQMTLLNSYIRN